MCSLLWLLTSWVLVVVESTLDMGVWEPDIGTGLSTIVEQDDSALVQPASNYL